MIVTCFDLAVYFFCFMVDDYLIINLFSTLTLFFVTEPSKKNHPGCLIPNTNEDILRRNRSTRSVELVPVTELLVLLELLSVLAGAWRSGWEVGSGPVGHVTWTGKSNG